MSKGRRLAISLLIPLLAAVIGSSFTFTEIPTWYADLVKPTFNPPNWLFGPVWTGLYLLMGYALYLVWSNTKASARARFVAYIAFWLQLVLNIAWSITFFGAHSIFQALLAIAVLLVAILWNIYAFAKVDKAAAWPLVPYLSWVIFASVLNFAIWQLNM